MRSGECWTSETLLSQIARRRQRLASFGVTNGTRIVIAHGGTPAFFADLFAGWSLGACCVCVNPFLARGELSTVVDFVLPKAVLVTAEAPASTAGLNVTVANLQEALPPTVDLPAMLPLGPDDPALILFTSGTTGDPKGVVHTGGSLAARVENNRRHLSAQVLQRSLCVLPTHFGHGLIGNCLTPLFAGARLHLYSTPGIQGTGRLADVLSEHGITFMSSVPAFWKVALKVAKSPVDSTLLQINIGSAPLSADLWGAVAAWSGADSVNNMYGITETANWAAGASSRTHAPEDGLVGTMWGGQAAVVGRDGECSPIGEGEIRLKTPSLMAGYYRRDDLTAEVLNDGWYDTGDQGSIDERGVIRLLGRLKTEINRAGTKVLPEEVDLLLEKHPSVAEACTFGIPDPINGEMVAVAVRVVGEGATPSELKEWCGERIRPDCVPERWFVVAEIPKTDRGKINRAVVREACMRERE